MDYRRLGRAGLKVSELSFGSWVTFGQQVGEDLALDCMGAAHDAGVNFFDNAEAYAAGFIPLRCSFSAWTCRGSSSNSTAPAR